MSKWDKLDEEFYNVIDNLTDEQWHDWKQKKTHNQTLRQAIQQMEIKIHLLKLYFHNFQGDTMFQESASNSEGFSSINEIEVNNKPLKKTTLQNYCLAA
jgi:S-adenosylmethionine hydrolase